jgi:iron(III) transport system substrate-binding protein
MNRIHRSLAALILAGAGAVMVAMPAAGAERLTLYCSPQIEWCNLMVAAFEKETGIDVAMTRKSSGETFAQIKAEERNPKGDIWWGGTGDPHLQAAEEGLTQEYRSPLFDQLNDWAKRQAANAQHRTVGIYAGALGFGYNEKLLKEKGMPEPKCWKDLTNPAFRGEIQIANPNSSGTAYTTLATIIQLFGERDGFEYMKALHKNVNQYTKSGSAPIKAAARGETTIGITFQHDIVTQVIQGFPVKIVSPCEGTGYEIGSMSIIKGARNLESARKFYDFALRSEIQSRAEEAQAYQVPSNARAKPPKGSPDLATIKLIDYDFKKYGSSEERRRLLAKWDEEIKSVPK